MTTATKNRPSTEPVVDDRLAPRVQFQIPRDDWCEILSDAAIFASRDAYTLALNAVKINVDMSGQITVSASDRFTLGIRRYQLGGPCGDNVQILLPLAEVAFIAKIHARTRRGVPNKLTVTIDGYLPLAADLPMRAGHLGIESRVNSRQITSWHTGMEAAPVPFEKFASPEPSEQSLIGFNPAYLARFAKVSRRAGESLHLTLGGPRRPTTVKIGEHFTGAIMPVRLPDDETEGEVS